MTGRRRDLVALCAIFGVITFVFADVLFGGRCFFLRDLLRFHYPSKAIVRAIVLDGEFPYWNRYFSAGQPLAANPQFEIFYVPQWLIFLRDYYLGFRLHILLHFHVAAVGTYVLLRTMQRRRLAAVFGALAFALGGIFVSCANLLPTMFPLAWMPWTLAFAIRFCRRGSPRDFAFGALSFGIALCAFEPATILETALLVGAVGLFCAIHEERTARPIVRGALLGVAGIALGAVQLLPLADHVRQTGRVRGMGSAMLAWWPFPPARIFEFFYPHFAGHAPLTDGPYWGSSLYPREGVPYFVSVYAGALVVIAVIIAALAYRRRPAALWIASLMVVFGAMSFGSPFLGSLRSLPPLGLIRYPERFLLGIGLLLAVAAAFGFELLIVDRAWSRRALIATAVLAVISVVVAWLLSSRAGASAFSEFWRMSDDGGAASVARADYLIAAGWFAAFSFALILLRRQPHFATRSLLALLAVADLAIMARDTAPTAPRELFVDPPASLSTIATRQYRLFHEASRHMSSPIARAYFSDPRTFPWSIRNALLPQIPALWRIPSVYESDVDATNLMPTVDVVDAMWRVRAVRRDWAEIFAAMGNVGYRAAFRPQQEAYAAAKSAREVDPVVFVPFSFAPRYYFASALVRVRDADDFVAKLSSGNYPRDVAFVGFEPYHPASGRVLQIGERDNGASISVESAGTSYLVMSVTPQKYWSATIDEVPAPIHTTNVGFQGMIVPPGVHTIRTRYRNPLIPIGAGVTLIALAAVGVFGFRKSAAAGFRDRPDAG